jgi:hypothetical protein
MFVRAVTDCMEQNPSWEAFTVTQIVKKFSNPSENLYVHIHGFTLFCLQNISFISKFVCTVLTFCFINICVSLWECVTVYRNLQHMKKRTVTWRSLLNSQYHWLYPLRILMFVTFTVQDLNNQVVGIYRSTKLKIVMKYMHYVRY